jgi:hypothetical protein
MNKLDDTPRVAAGFFSNMYYKSTSICGRDLIVQEN